MANSAPGAHRAGRTLGTSAASESYIDFLKMVFGVAGAAGSRMGGGRRAQMDVCFTNSVSVMLWVTADL